MQQEIGDKMRVLKQDISSTRGRFSLFGLFRREEAPEGKWDLVVSAPWIETDTKGGLRYLADKVHAMLTSEELLFISRIVVLRMDDPFVKAVHSRAKNVRRAKVVLQNEDFAGVQIACSDIIASTTDLPKVRKFGSQ